MSRRVETVVAHLEAAIAQGRYASGARLPAERVLGAALGVSRATVRDALAALVSRGLLQRRQGDGTYVNDQADRQMAEVWADMAERHPALQGDLIEFREMLESRAAALAATRHDARDRERLLATLAAVDAAYDGEDRAAQIRSDIAFHRAIAEATHNPLFAYLMTSLLRLLHEHVQLSLAGLAPHSDTARQLRLQHRALAEAILARDPERARRCAGSHIDFVGVRLNAMPRPARGRQPGSDGHRD